MPVVHFLNVKDGDCSIIEHVSGHVTVIDVCNAKPTTLLEEVSAYTSPISAALERGVNGDFNQKEYPVNPILYMRDHGLKQVFRFILTHPDMDHMDGIKAFFDALRPENFWDTNNRKECEFDEDGISNGYRKEDWDFYQKLRDNKLAEDPRRLALYAGQKGQYWNMNAEGESGGDGLQILAPTATLLKAANLLGDYNDSSYVILYRSASGNRILFAGDSHDATWEYILKHHAASVSDVDILVAPHHGRHSDRDWDFLKVVNPALTLFGNAPSKHLAYSAWRRRGLPIITNNQAGCVVLNADVSPAEVYVTCQAYAKTQNPHTTYNNTFRGYYIGTVRKRQKATAAAV